MVVANFWDVLWTMLLVFAWIAFFMLLFFVWADIFRRDDMGWFMKIVWLLVTLLLPFLGIFIYVIINGDDMAKRSQQQAVQQVQATNEYIRTVAGTTATPADQIRTANELLEKGAITQEEYDAIKANALGGSTTPPAAGTSPA